MKCHIENFDAYLLVHNARGFERCRQWVRQDLEAAKKNPALRSHYLRTARQYGGWAREYYRGGMAAADALSK